MGSPTVRQALPSSQFPPRMQRFQGASDYTRASQLLSGDTLIPGQVPRPDPPHNAPPRPGPTRWVPLRPPPEPCSQDELPSASLMAPPPPEPHQPFEVHFILRALAGGHLSASLASPDALSCGAEILPSSQHSALGLVGILKGRKEGWMDGRMDGWDGRSLNQPYSHPHPGPPCSPPQSHCNTCWTGSIGTFCWSAKPSKKATVARGSRVRLRLLTVPGQAGEPARPDPAPPPPAA